MNLWIVVAVAIAAIATIGFVTARGGEPASAPVTFPTTTAPADGATTTSSPPAGRLYKGANGAYSMPLGPTWTDGPMGFAGSPTWIVPMAAAGTAEVAIVFEHLGAPVSLEQYVIDRTDRLNRGGTHRVTGSRPATLADGSAATVLTYTAADGSLLAGEAIATVKGLDAVHVMSRCPPDGADACFAALAPFTTSVSLV